MRTSNDTDNDRSAYYVDDAPYGGRIIACCCVDGEGNEFLDDTEYGEPLYCPRCKVELFYRSWYEW